MAITGYSTERIGNTVVVTVTSDLTEPIYYHWYKDGAYVAMTAAPQRSFYVDFGEQLNIVAVDTEDPDFDPLAAPPDGWPARRTIWWIRSVDESTVRYDVAQSYNDPEVLLGEIIASVPATGAWAYAVLTPPLNDLYTYFWTITPYDAAGNAGDEVTLSEEVVVRRPDAPDVDIAYSAGTQRVTISAAA